MADNTTYSAVPSKHIFLYELNKETLRAKVRFLCRVILYDESKGELHVEHRYPASTSNTITSAIVNIDLIRASLKREHIQQGVWLNVIGYITQIPKTQVSKNTRRVARTGLCAVQAVVIWSADAIRLNDYEDTLRKQRDLDLERQTVE